MNKKNMALLFVFLLVGLYYTISLSPSELTETEANIIIDSIFTSFNKTPTNVYLIESELLIFKLESLSDIKYHILNETDKDRMIMSRNGSWFYYYHIDRINFITPKNVVVRISKVCSIYRNGVIEEGGCGTYTYNARKEQDEWLVELSRVVVN